MNHNSTVSVVTTVLVETLGIEDRKDSIDASTELLGGVPELDSLAILELASALEDRFEIVIDDEDFTGNVFETVGTLAELIDSKRASVGG